MDLGRELERFGGGVDAYLYFALTRTDQTETFDRFVAALALPWGEWLAEWLELSGRISPFQRAQRLRAEVVVRLPNQAFDHVHVIFPRLAQPGVLSDDDLDDTIRWFLSNADATHAPLAADALSANLPERAATPLGHWLLSNGLAELRRSGRLELLVKLTQHPQDLDSLTAVFRALVQNEARLSVVRAEVVLNGLERILEARPSLADLAIDLLAKAEVRERQAWIGAVFHGPPLWPEGSWQDGLLDAAVPPRAEKPGVAAWPRIAEALTRAAFNRKVDAQSAFAIWAHLIGNQIPPPSGARFRDADVLEQVVETLFRSLGSGKVHPSWVATVVEELRRIHAPVARGSEASKAWATIDRLGGYEPALMHDMLVQEAASAERGELSALLTDIPASWEGVRCVVRVARQMTPRVRTIEPSIDLEPIRRHIETVMHASWASEVGGVRLATLAPRFRRLVFSALGETDSIRIEDDVIRVDDEEIRSLAANPGPSDDTLALATLYVLHELIHRQQQCGGKKLIRDLRATGAETTLLHLDLAADHAAALLTRDAVPRWTLSSLKNLQGLSLAAFPVTRRHPFAARTRKALRVVALRADYLLRGADAASEKDGYAFVDYGLNGGPAFILVSGALLSIVRTGQLTVAQAGVLAAAADEGSDIMKVDETLAPIVGH